MAAKTSNTDGLVFYLGSIPLAFEYKNVKNITLRVYPGDGSVKLTAPLGASSEEILNFACSKKKWIEKHREKFLNQDADQKRSAGSLLRNHSTVYVWGRAYELELVKHSGNSKMILDGNYMKMYIRP